MSHRDNERTETEIRQYDSKGDFERQQRLMADDGWTTKSVSATDGHINLGRTVGGMALTGGASLLFGGSRTKGKITVVYERTESGGRSAAVRTAAHQARRANELQGMSGWRRALSQLGQAADAINENIDRNKGR